MKAGGGRGGEEVGHTKLRQSFVDYSTHFQSTHPTLVIDEQHQIIPIFKFDKRSLGIILLKYQIK